ncbi:translational GTPase TypA [Candidatus Uhrbacteria bacterium]|nr:translational GTPase TypA [Candidatus Uhrbacteria bacterium]
MNIRNVAIIAHVDHGKTTLVDALLRQSKTELHKHVADELIMDSNELERERGITIFSKNASVVYQGTKINIIDTPGHADFGGEVERVLKMADGVLLLIDAQEGPMPQTRFVLKRALELKHKVIVVINKIDKPNARILYAMEKTFELFIDLGANDEQVDFPVVYAAARLGKAGLSGDLESMTDISPIFDAILKYVPEPVGDSNAPFQMLVTSLAGDTYKGKIAIGRIANGAISDVAQVMHITRDGKQTVQKITALMTFQGLGRVAAQSVSAGDLIAVAGIPEVNIGDTLADKDNPIAITPFAIEQPTVKMSFSVNNSPFAGNEGTYCTSRNIHERLFKELDTDVALRVEVGNGADEFVVSGRGELHLAILIERMRREGYEFQVSRPEVIMIEEGGMKKEPMEDVWIDVPEEYTGTVIERMGRRKGELKNMHVDGGKATFHFTIPTRGLIGYRNEFLTTTRGLGIMNTLFAGFAPLFGDIESNPHGSLIAFEPGTANTYGLINAQGRGTLFIEPGLEVYEGQIVGQNSKDEDLEVNVCKEKRLSNMRSKGEGVAEGLDTPRIMGLEEALEYIGDDELVEVTPKCIRLRKKLLSMNDRKKVKRPS